MSFLEPLLSRVGVLELAILFFALFLLKWVLGLLRDPLFAIPGPSLTRFTRLWLLRQYIKGDFQKTNVELHMQYGPIVRIAPNQYSIDSPEAAKIIYGHGSDFTKSNWYVPWGHANSKFKNLFNEQDPHIHAQQRRKIASAYSMSSIVSYEPYVDQCTTILLQRLSEFSTSGVIFNLGHWLQCYAFETVGMITFSKRLGFLDSGEDVRGIMEQLEVGMLYSSVVGLYSSLHQILLTSIAAMSREVKGTAFIDMFSADLINTRIQEKQPNTDGPQDLVAKLLNAQKENPEKISNVDIRTSIAANVAAGSDTTSITLSAIVYNLIQSPKTLRKLREELDSASREGKISDPLTFAEAQKLAYLQAVIKEGLRIHPATGFTMPRVVPKGGKEIMGIHMPAGTVVGINAWVAHQNRDVFGTDAKTFRPERWLESKEASSKRDAYFFTFGQGSRTCIGKHISLLEISKAIPQIVQHLDIEIENKQEWSIVTHWFAKPTNFICRVNHRSSTGQREDLRV